MEAEERIIIMLEFKMTKETESIVEYKYFPEGDDVFGIVQYDKINKKCSIIKYAPNYDNSEFAPYAIQFFSRIRKYAAEGSFQQEGMVAWY